MIASIESPLDLLSKPPRQARSSNKAEPAT